MNTGTERFYTEYKAMRPMAEQFRKTENPLNIDEILQKLRTGVECADVNVQMIKENATDAQIAEFAEFAAAETNVRKKTELLSLFRSNICKYPLSPIPLIETVRKYESAITEKSFADGRYQLVVMLVGVLSQLRTPEVREYGFNLMHRGMVWLGFDIWAHNYLTEDKEKFVEFVKNVPDDPSEAFIFNRVQNAVIHMFFDGIPDAPSELLTYIYETTYCSSCRYKAICCMENLGIMTDAMREECRSDCSWEMRDRYCRYDFNKIKK
jgi:hypothetical protein